MNCRHCGVGLSSRPMARVIMTGLLLVVGALVLLVLVHLAVVMLAGVLLLVAGGTMLTGAVRIWMRRCPSCGRFPY